MFLDAAGPAFLQHMDSLLLSYLRLTEESEQQALLDELILVHAAPIVRNTLRQRLGFYVSQTGRNPYHPDAEDLYQGVMTKLVGRISVLRSRPDELLIQDYRKYVAGVAVNACIDYLREKWPERAQLKCRVRHLLERHPDFEVRREDGSVYLCGFAGRQRREGDLAPAGRLARLTEDPELLTSKLPRADVRSVPLTRVAAEIFEWAGGPVDLDDLVTLLAGLLRINCRAAESINREDGHPYDAPDDPGARPDDHLERREALARLWEEIRRLPPKQREAVCLLAADEKGDDLFSAFVDAGVTDLPRIAETLNFSLERLMAIWEKMPLAPENLAAELGTTRSQVNLRHHRGLKRLGERLIKAPGKK